MCVAALVALAGPTVATAQTELAPTVVVLDASGSMTAADAGGVMRMDAAKQAVDGFLSGVPEDAPLGLVTYGTGTGSGDEEKEAGCKDITVLSGVGEKPIDELKAQVAGLQPRGYTPIGNSLLKANELLPKEGARSIVLVSDGVDTCAPPPVCEVAKTLKDQGTDLVVHTIGFMVDAAARAELECVAQVTGGTYADASSADSLTATLKQATTRTAVGYQVPSETIEFGRDKGDAPTIEPGTLEDPLHVHALVPNPAEEKSYAKVKVPEGHRLHVGFNVVPGFGAAGAFENDFKFIPSFENEEGDLCYTSNSTNAIDAIGNYPLAAHAISEVMGSTSSCEGEYLYIGISKSADFDDLDMVILTVPEPTDLGDASMKSESNERQDSDLSDAAPAGELKDVTPAYQPDLNATPLSGTVVSEIVSGETQYFPVNVDWGQAMDVTVEVLDDPAGADMDVRDKYQRQFIFEIQNSLLQDQKIIGTDYYNSHEFDSPAVFGMAQPVSFSNVKSNPSWLAGTHFVQVSLTGTGNLEGDDLAAVKQQPMKYRLTFTPVGDAVKGPTFDGKAAPAASATSATAAEAEPTPQAQQEQSSWLPKFLWSAIGILVLLVIVTCTVIVLLSRRGKNTPQQF